MSPLQRRRLSPLSESTKHVKLDAPESLPQGPAAGRDTQCLRAPAHGETIERSLLTAVKLSSALATCFENASKTYDDKRDNSTAAKRDQGMRKRLATRLFISVQAALQARRALFERRALYERRPL